jgi:hypothetical protein
MITIFEATKATQSFTTQIHGKNTARVNYLKKILDGSV